MSEIVLTLTEEQLREIMRNFANTFVHYGQGEGRNAAYAGERVTALSEALLGILSQLKDRAVLSEEPMIVETQKMTTALLEYERGHPGAEPNRLLSWLLAP